MYNEDREMLKAGKQVLGKYGKKLLKIYSRVWR